jgi:hypothetical protein
VLDLLTLEARALLEKRKLYAVGDKVTRRDGTEFEKTPNGWRRVPQGRKRGTAGGDRGGQPSSGAARSRAGSPSRRTGTPKFSSPSPLDIKGGGAGKESLPVRLAQSKLGRAAEKSKLVRGVVTKLVGKYGTDADKRLVKDRWGPKPDKGDTGAADIAAAASTLHPALGDLFKKNPKLAKKAAGIAQRWFGK